MTEHSGPERVAVAMSGGMDSSVAAAILVEQGCNVVGFTAHMWKDGSRCCSEEDVARARKVAWQLGIDHFVLNAEQDFNRYVVDPFISEYLRGRTPSPCVLCNQKIKFGFLMTRAVQIHCKALATGHYAKVGERDGLYRLYRAADRSRDQSYFLHRLSQRQLAHARFPLAALNKKEDVKALAEKYSLPAVSRGESQDLCFVPPDQYGDFVEARTGKIPAEGRLVDADGREIGRHRGIHRYTIGQRRGLGLAEGAPLYVTRIDAETNTIEVGNRDEALAPACLVEDPSWIAGCAPDTERTYTVQIRYRHEAAPARISLRGDNVLVEFDEPQFAVTPGQAAVFYDGDEVLGGGWVMGRGRMQRQRQSMKVVVNGKEYDHEGDGTLGSLLNEIHADCGRVAVMINDRVIKRDGYAAANLADGDRIEILMFAAGG